MSEIKISVSNQNQPDNSSPKFANHYLSQPSTLHSIRKENSLLFMQETESPSKNPVPSPKHPRKKRNNQKTQAGENPPTMANSNNQIPHPNVEAILLEEITNLREKNKFLIGKIKDLFNREIIYKQKLAFSNLAIQRLEGFNAQLRTQMQNLIDSFLTEMERIEAKLTDTDSSFSEGTLRTSSSAQSIGVQLTACFEETSLKLKQQIQHILEGEPASGWDDSKTTALRRNTMRRKDKNIIDWPVTAAEKQQNGTGTKIPFCSASETYSREPAGKRQFTPLFKIFEAQQSLVTLGRRAPKSRYTQR